MFAISTFGVEPDRHRCLRPTKQLSTSTQTEVRFLKEASSTSYLSPAMPLASQLLLKDFREINGQSNCIVNLCGFVTHLSDVTLPRQEVPMRNFMIQDMSGLYMTCCLHGRLSYDESLQDKAYIAIFLAVASPGVGSHPGMLWLYGISRLIIQRPACTVPPSLQAVEL